MRTLDIPMRVLSQEEKKQFLGKSGKASDMGRYLDLEGEDLSDGGLLIRDSSTGKSLVFIGEMEHYDTQAVFDYLGGLKIKADARLSRGVVSNHVQIGFQPAAGLRGNFCSPTAATRDHYDLRVFGYYMSLYGEEQYKRVLPEMYSKHVEEMQKLKDPGMRMAPGSLFTSAVINRSNQIQYHYDRGNTKEGGTLMCYVCRGVTGGELLVPELDLAVNIRDNVFIIMEGHRLIHGVAPMSKEDGGERYSVVFYSKRDLFRCQTTLDDEVKKTNTGYTINFVNKLDRYSELRKMSAKSWEKLKSRYSEHMDPDLLQ